MTSTTGLKGGLNLTAALRQLRSHDLTALFTQSLGWHSIQPSETKLPQRVKQLSLSGTPIAHKHGVVVWQVTLTEKTVFTTELRQQIYQAIAAVSLEEMVAPVSISKPIKTLGTNHLGAGDANVNNSNVSNSNLEALALNASPPKAGTGPLVIFVNSEKTRSLWCQVSTASTLESAVYVSGQPAALWVYRLRRLARNGAEPLNSVLFPTIMADRAAANYETFEQLLKALCSGISGISNTADRQKYALLTMQRLIFIQSLQQKGWIAEDTWYLQTRFGQILQQGKSLFFEHCLQPLYKGLAMPALERPLALGQAVGAVPFLGGLFDTHRLEEQYGNISIENPPFETILGWLSEQSGTGNFDPWMSGELGYLLERYWAQQVRPQQDYIGTPETARTLSHLTLDALLLTRIKSRMVANDAGLPTNSASALNHILFNADTGLCRLLIQTILPSLRLLDPACGSGNLLAAFHQRLAEIFALLTGYIQQKQDAQLRLWQSDLSESIEDVDSEKQGLLQSIQKRILRNTLYGVELLPGAAATTRWQLLLHVVATAQQPKDIEPLPDLSFNIMTGNSLVGFIRVDEERFDRVNQAGAGSILQGNLLQPLAADSYQTILAEKNLALEHYKSRNQTLADASNIPLYAMAALLREDILRLDTKAQHKLDTLLLSHMSQQLGIQYKATQLTDRPQRQPLTLDDIDILQPFHWGYHFNKIIKQGGFDGIVCAPPWGTFKPTAEEFFQRFQDLALAKGMEASDLKTSKQALAGGDPEVAQAWLFYQDQYAYVSDYFYRSEDYAHQNPRVKGKLVRNQLARERLFVERCLMLLAPDGFSTVVLPSRLAEEPKAIALYEFIQTHAQFREWAGEAVMDSKGAIASWQKYQTT